MQSSTLNTGGQAVEPGRAPKERILLETSVLLLISLLTLVCYAPVLFNFFNGDDFVHLTWLSQAIHHPELVLRNFYTSWLDGTTTKFYRPLISVFMVSDYAIWGVNGLGFRLTNLIFHLSSAIWIYLICKQLQQNQGTTSSSEVACQKPSSAGTPLQSLVWPVAGAALFALYPLHPEAVSWITGRVDSIVTAFCLGSVYFYLRYSAASRPVFLALSMVAASLGLLSKEMAVTLPAVFVLYELIYGQSWTGSHSISTVTRSAVKSAARTWPFWLLLAVYFAARRLALGTFVGGYDDSLFFISNPREFLNGWVHAMGMFLIPINKSLLGSHHILSKLWQVALVLCLGTTGLGMILDSRIRRNFLFISGWLLLCLVPVYKLFNISDDLQGSRLAYLATVPLCMLLTCGVSPCRPRQKFVSGTRLIMAFICILAGILLWTNNLPWKEAGLENNAIRASLSALYDKIPGDPPVLFLGLPDQIQGAYTCRNSLYGMTKKPQLNRDINDCLMVNAFEPIFPYGYLKDSIAENKDKILIYRWNSSARTFDKINIDEDPAPAQNSEWQKTSLKKCINLPEQKVKPQIAWQNDGTLSVRSAGNQPQFLEFNLGNNSCFNTDFVELDLRLAKPAASESGADLLYSNDMYPAFELRRRSRAYFTPSVLDQRLLFALHGLPEWSLGGRTHNFRFMIPSNSTMTITAISLVPKQLVMPAISFDNSGYFGSKGFIHLSARQKETRLKVDISKVTGASKFARELTRTNLLFEDQNTQIRSKVAGLYQVCDQSQGDLVLKWADFKSAGMYEIRIFPLSENNTICGVASDHLVISVD